MNDRLSEALADRYRIERELGQGGMATVYLARDLKHDRDVAIKVLNPDLSQTRGAERFCARSNSPRGSVIRTSCPCSIQAKQAARCSTSCRASRGRRCAIDCTTRSSYRSTKRCA